MNSPKTSPSALTRREAVKLMGAGAALLGLGAFPSQAAETSEPAASQPSIAPQPFVLPSLHMAYNALEPHIDAKTMEIHHSKHHATYIANANKALEGHPELQKMTGEEILSNLDKVPESIRTAVRNNVGGHVNHSLFWLTLRPTGLMPTGDLKAAIVKKFGSYAEFQAQFADAAMKRFGSGWAWLSVKNQELVIHSTANQDSPLSEGAKPLLGLDVWEHAYYLKHQNVRADYIADFWKVTGWKQAADNYSWAMG